MKYFQKSPGLVALAVMAMMACSGEKTSSNEGVDSSEAAQVHSADSITAVFDPDPTDTIPASEYVALASDTAVASRIGKVLPVILEKQLVGAEAKDRRFAFDQADLNGDGKNELLVGFTGMNWCGSGGCTALVLSSEGKLITLFTVVGFPFTVLESKTGGWNDLVVHSGHADRLLKWNGSKYPSNPSVAPKFTGKLSDDFTKVLWLSDKAYPWFSF